MNWPSRRNPSPTPQTTMQHRPSTPPPLLRTHALHAASLRDDPRRAWSRPKLFENLKITHCCHTRTVLTAAAAKLTVSASAVDATPPTAPTRRALHMHVAASLDCIHTCTQSTFRDC